MPLLRLTMLAVLALPAAAGADNFSSIHRIDSELGSTYRSGAAYDPSGRSVQVLTTLEDEKSARRYGEQVENMGKDWTEMAGRFASFAALYTLSGPAMENAGVVLLSPDDQLPTVAGLTLVYGRLNRGKVEKVAGYLAFDGHIHSGRSHDGGDSYETVLLNAARRGLDAIAITDHNEFDYARIKKELERLQAEGRISADFLVVPGEEISSSEGHILAYFIQSKIEGGLSASETIRAIHAQGGLAVAAHPSIGDGGVGIYNATRLEFDGIEAASGANILPANMLQDIAAAEHGVGDKFLMANSDAHAAKGLGVMYTRVQAAPTLESLRYGLVRRRSQPVVDSETFRRYISIMQSRPGRVVLWPVLTYLQVKGRILSTLAALVIVDRINVMTTWENAALRMANGIFLPAEAVKFAGNRSDLQKPLALRTISVSKGPMRVAYESFDLMGFTRPAPMFKLEARVEF